MSGNNLGMHDVFGMHAFARSSGYDDQRQRMVAKAMGSLIISVLSDPSLPLGQSVQTSGNGKVEILTSDELEYFLMTKETEPAEYFKRLFQHKEMPAYVLTESRLERGPAPATMLAAYTEVYKKTLIVSIVGMAGKTFHCDENDMCTEEEFSELLTCIMFFGPAAKLRTIPRKAYKVLRELMIEPMAHFEPRLDNLLDVINAARADIDHKVGFAGRAKLLSAPLALAIASLGDVTKRRDLISWIAAEATRDRAAFFAACELLNVSIKCGDGELTVTYKD